MRISDWAQKFNIVVTPFDAISSPPYGAAIYRVKDIWTTRDGSWDVSDKPGSLPQWARDEYLRKEFDDAGADHHIFGRVLGETAEIHYWTHADDGNHVTMQAKPQSGWANVTMWASSAYVPDRGERGPWAWVPNVAYGDIVMGAGMPAKQHVSWFATWVKETYQGGIVIPPDPIEPPTGDHEQRIAALEAKMTQLQALMRQWVADS